VESLSKEVFKGVKIRQISEVSKHFLEGLQNVKETLRYRASNKVGALQVTRVSV